MAFQICSINYYEDWRFGHRTISVLTKILGQLSFPPLTDNITRKIESM